LSFSLPLQIILMVLENLHHCWFLIISTIDKVWVIQFYLLKHMSNYTYRFIINCFYCHINISYFHYQIETLQVIVTIKLTHYKLFPLSNWHITIYFHYQIDTLQVISTIKLTHYKLFPLSNWHIISYFHYQIDTLNVISTIKLTHYKLFPLSNWQITSYFHYQIDTLQVISTIKLTHYKLFQKIEMFYPMKW
jgi:1,2-phenylacetyl-CoA epoxidase catalytic subunit